MQSPDKSDVAATRGTLSLKLVNMPFADWFRPSFALSQLAALVQRDLGDEIDTQVCYLNLDFAAHFGGTLYEGIAEEGRNQTSGIGDWIFRQIAFPDRDDNSAEYFERYFADSSWTEFRRNIADMRSRLERFCAELIDRYDLAAADIVGFTALFAQNTASLGLARLIKERNPDVTIVMGGANCETPMGAVLVENSPMIDFAFSGPALSSFLDFLRCKLRGNEGGLHEIRGVVSRKNCRNPRFRTSVGRERDIDDYVDPEYDSFVAAFEANKATIASSLGVKRVKPRLYFETSRGCWWGQRSHCTFCGLNDETIGYKMMSPDNALRQLRSLFRFAPWCLDYSCSDNIMPKNYPDEVFRVLDSPVGSSIFYMMKLPVSEKDLQLIARARVNKIQPGLEALSTATLRLMGKGTTAFQNLQFLKNTVRFGINPIWNLLIGFPGEDEDTYRKYQQLIPLLRHLPPPTGANEVRFDRYSPYFNRSAEYNLDLHPMDFYSFVYPFDPADIADLAHFFQDKNVSSPYAVNVARWSPRLNDSVNQWRAEWRNAERRSKLLLQRKADGGHLIYDSRGETIKTYDVDEEMVVMLHRLSSPIRRDRVAAEFGLSSQAASDRLSFLRANLLLFEEGDHMMSLVITEAEQDSLTDVAPSSEAPKDLSAPTDATRLLITEVPRPR